MIREVYIGDNFLFSMPCTIGLSFIEAIESTKEVKKQLLEKGTIPQNTKMRIVSKTKGVSDWI